VSDGVLFAYLGAVDTEPATVSFLILLALVFSAPFMVAPMKIRMSPRLLEALRHDYLSSRLPSVLARLEKALWVSIVTAAAVSIGLLLLDRLGRL